MGLTRLIAQARLDEKVYHRDGIFGLSFIGEFAFKTAAMFFSGWLFAPLILLSVNYRNFFQYFTSIQSLLLLTYFCFTAASFLIPIYIIHYKILREKMLRAAPYYQAANRLAKSLRIKIAEEKLKRFDFSKKMIDEIRAIPNWPLRLDTALKFMATSILFPTIAAALSAILKSRVGGP
jgi:hypothetical protein